MTPDVISYSDALDVLEHAVASDVRNQIVDALLAKGDFSRAIRQLRGAMRSHTFATGSGPLALARLVRAFDEPTRAEGFHALESWDYRAHRFADDIAPVLMLDRCASGDISEGMQRRVLGVLLDHYFLTILGLFALRAWDRGDANANLGRVTEIIAALNGPGGSGLRLVDNAETLLLVAISHYHPHEQAYDTLIHRVWTLDSPAALRLATACSATLGSHLRWGHRFMYQRDVGRMRQDNVVDYPWLLFSLATLMRAYESASGADTRQTLAEALLNGLSADPWAFTGEAPGMLSPFAATHGVLRRALAAQAGRLREDFEVWRPNAPRYTPLGFLCNFLCNAVVAMAATDIGAAIDHPSLNGLFTGHADQDAAAAVAQYAGSLMAYALNNGGRADGAALIVYDLHEAHSAFNTTMRIIDGASPR